MPASARARSRRAAAATTHSVVLKDIQFQPASITITAGDTVKWTHQDGATAHTVTADDGSFDQQMPAQGATFSHAFKTPGTFRYYCRIHGAPGGQGMSGVITVKAASPATTAAPTTTRPPPTSAPATAVPSATPTTAAAAPVSTVPTTPSTASATSTSSTTST